MEEGKKGFMPLSLIVVIIQACVKVVGWAYELIMAAINKNKSKTPPAETPPTPPENAH